MLITYYQDGSRATRQFAPILSLFLTLNSLFSFCILFAWTYISYIVSEPLSWATWMPINRGYGLLGVLEYPFVLLWLFPLIGVAGAWTAVKARKTTLAYSFAAIPVVTLLLIFGWYYMAPPDWR